MWAWRCLVVLPCDPQWFHQARGTWEVWGAHQMLGHQYADAWYSCLGAGVSRLSRQNSVVVEQLFLFNSVYQGYSGVSWPWHWPHLFQWEEGKTVD